jgi:hypothetical protein
VREHPAARVARQPPAPCRCCVAFGLFQAEPPEYRHASAVLGHRRPHEGRAQCSAVDLLSSQRALNQGLPDREQACAVCHAEHVPPRDGQARPLRPRAAQALFPFALEAAGNQPIIGMRPIAPLGPAAAELSASSSSTPRCKRGHLQLQNRPYRVADFFMSSPPRYSPRSLA